MFYDGFLRHFQDWLLEVLRADGGHEVKKVTLVLNVDQPVVEHAQTFVVE